MDRAGNYRAIKIYKIDTSDFRHMDEYLRFDRRFEHIKPEKRSIVHAWTQKEFTTLLKLQKFHVNAPKPQIAKENILVMEFIGTKEGEAAPKLKDSHIEDIHQFYAALTQNIARMLEAKLIHGDLSDYNILVKDDRPVIIDVGQIIPTTHPNAKMFYERDLNNLLKVLHRHGMKELTFEQFYADVKAAKEEISKK
jgi:RIO kinase 1